MKDLELMARKTINRAYELIEEDDEIIRITENGLIAEVTKALLSVRKDAYRECAELIQDDAYAISFQSMGQYRSALLKAILSKMEELK
jgi:CTP-dependent riboflavin kinase